MAPNILYSRVFFVYGAIAGEQLLANDNVNAKHILIQNNTASDLNALLFKDDGPTTHPFEFAVRAGGSASIPADFGSFFIYSAQTEPPNDAIPPAGKGGTYDGPDAAGSNVTGYVTVSAYDEPMAITITGDPVTSNAQLTGALPAGGNNIGSVNVAEFPELPAGTNNIGSVNVAALPGWTWQKVTAAAAGAEQVKAAAGQVAQLVGDAGNAGVTMYLQDGASQAWNTGDYTGAFPIACQTSIQINFSAAGSAWILFK